MGVTHYNKICIVMLLYNICFIVLFIQFCITFLITKISKDIPDLMKRDCGHIWFADREFHPIYSWYTHILKIDHWVVIFWRCEICPHCRVLYKVFSKIIIVRSRQLYLTNTRDILYIERQKYRQLLAIIKLYDLTK